MTYILMVITLSSILGCNNVEHNTNNSSESPVLEPLSVEISTIKPSSEFVSFVKEIELDGWIYDTSRFEKVDLYGLKDAKTTSFNSYPFYDIPFEMTQVNQVLKHNRTPEQKAAHLILSKTKQIWGYFYRDKNATNFISDGVIEQWYFDDSTIAGLAFDQLTAFVGHIYFNTMPFLFKKKNMIFIFHTRAMAFSYDQKPIYDNFVAQMNN